MWNILLIGLIILFVLVCIWPYLPQNITEQVEQYFWFDEAFETDELVDLSKLPEPYRFEIPPEETVAFTKIPKLSFAKLKSYFQDDLDIHNMTFIFDLVVQDDRVDQDVLSFENTTDFHRISFTKVPNSRRLKVSTSAFSSTGNTNHSEKIRKYELEKFLEENPPSKEAEAISETTETKEGFETPENIPEETLTYVVTYENELTNVFETKNGSTIQATQSEGLLNDININEETVIFVGSSNSYSTESENKEDEECLVKNMRLYNRVLTIKELDAIIFNRKTK